jgi:hypothetical protein
MVGIQLLRLRSWGTMRPDLRQVFALRVALGQIATLPFVVAGAPRRCLRAAYSGSVSPPVSSPFNSASSLISA